MVRPIPLSAIPPDTVARVIALRMEPRSVPRIAEASGISPYVVRKILRAAGIALPRRASRVHVRVHTMKLGEPIVIILRPVVLPRKWWHLQPYSAEQQFEMRRDASAYMARRKRTPGNYRPPPAFWTHSKARKSKAQREREKQGRREYREQLRWSGQ